MLLAKKDRMASAPTKGDAAPFEVDDARYRDWIAHVFDRETTRDRWYFDIYPVPDFRAGAVETVSLIGRTVARCGIDLRDFHDKQIAHGLEYIFDQTASDYVYSFASPEVPVGLKVAAVNAMKSLYSDCLGVRCGPYLGHLSEGKGRPLNNFAYMLWDTTPILWFDQNDRELFQAWLGVMDLALGLANDACVESALHGLGHMYHRDPERVGKIIDRFLAYTIDARNSAAECERQASQRSIRSALRAYAHSARCGMVV